MDKYQIVTLICFTIILLTSCAPSPSQIQNAIEKTQEYCDSRTYANIIADVHIATDF